MQYHKFGEPFEGSIRPVSVMSVCLVLVPGYRVLLGCVP